MKKLPILLALLCYMHQLLAQDPVVPQCAILYEELIQGNKYTSLGYIFKSRDDYNNIIMYLGSASNEYSDLLMGCAQPTYTAYAVLRTYTSDFSSKLSEECAPYPSPMEDGTRLPQRPYFYPQPNGDTILFTTGYYPDMGRDLVVERKNGTMIWRKHYGSTGAEDPVGIIETTDGCFINSCAVGDGGGDIGALYGGADMWVIKVDTAGDIVWSRVLGGTGWDIFMSMVPTPDGGMIAFGSTTSTDHDISENKGSVDIWVIRLDGDGNTLWSRTYGGSGIDGTGILTSVRAISDANSDGYYLLSSTASQDGDIQHRLPMAGTGEGMDYDFWLLKIDADGELLWERTYGSSYREIAYAICQAADGSIWIGGEVEKLATPFVQGHLLGYYGGGRDAWILRVDSTGTPLQQLVVGGSREDELRALFPLPDGTVLAGGRSNGGSGTDTNPRSPGLPQTGNYHSNSVFLLRLAPWTMGINAPEATPIAWELYPNPADRGEVQVRISGMNQCYYTLAIYDANGRMMEYTSIQTCIYTIHTSHYTAGTYTLSITDNNGLKTSQIFIVK